MLATIRWLIIAQFTLGVLSRTSFNYRYPWANTTDNKGVPFERALTTILTMKEVIVRLATPNWAYKLPIERYACHLMSTAVD